MVPKYVLDILNVLKKNDYVAYVVGGAVRDIALSKSPKDYDIATSAKPDEVKMLFDKVVPTGEKHGTVTVVINGEHCEVTTFRTESKYSDLRRPDEVSFAENIEEDLSRRDFTINAMAQDVDGVIVDPFGGLKDIQSRIIQTVGDPDDRFGEDPLRMLRAIRFAAQLDFSIENKTILSIKRNSFLIQNISKERVRDEMCKMIVSDRPSESVRLLEYTNLLSFIVPELLAGIDFQQRNPHHDKNIFDHTLSVLDHTPPILVTRWGALLHDIAKPWTFSVDEKGIGHFYGHQLKGADMTENILRRLKFDIDTVVKVKNLVQEHMNKSIEPKKNTIKKMLVRVGEDNIDNLLDLQIADILGCRQTTQSESYIQGIKKTREFVREIMDHKEPMTVKDLALNGHDIMELGYKGREIGTVLSDLLDVVLEDADMNKREKLLQLAHDFRIK